MAQLVAHLLCKQGVTGSSPVSSTFHPQPDGCGFSSFVSLHNFCGLLARVLTDVTHGLRVKMCVWLGVSRGLDLAFLNAD